MTFTLQWLQENFVNLGWIKNASNPKTKKFWKEQRNWNILLDEEVQLKALNDIYLTVQEAKKKNKEIVVVCQKSGLADMVASLAKQHKFHYFTHKVPAGFLTNFETLFSTIKDMNERRQFIKSESFMRLTKKERSMVERHLAKIEKIYEGVKDLSKKPDLVVVVDGTMLDGLVNEIRISKTPSVILASTGFSYRQADNQLAIVNLQNQKSPSYILETLFA